MSCGSQAGESLHYISPPARDDLLVPCLPQTFTRFLQGQITEKGAVA